MSAVNQNLPRKHHVLPVSYLRNFCDPDGNLYVYERGRRPRKSVPKSEAYVRDFYAIESEQGKTFEIEEILGRYESEAAPVMRGILEREASGDRWLLTESEVDILTHFVALTFQRVPAGRRHADEHVAPAVKHLLTSAANDRDKFVALEPIS